MSKTWILLQREKLRTKRLGICGTSEYKIYSLIEYFFKHASFLPLSTARADSWFLSPPTDQPVGPENYDDPYRLQKPFAY